MGQAHSQRVISEPTGQELWLAVVIPAVSPAVCDQPTAHTGLLEAHPAGDRRRLDTSSPPAVGPVIGGNTATVVRPHAHLSEEDLPARDRDRLQPATQPTVSQLTVIAETPTEGQVRQGDPTAMLIAAVHLDESEAPCHRSWAGAVPGGAVAQLA